MMRPVEICMRTTLDIDDDVLAAAKELSRQQGRSAGAVVSALLRQALTGSAGGARVKRPVRAVAGFRPFASRGKAVTNELIHTLRDAEGA
jgi:Arc/MetJ family transcription regulator